MWLGCCYLRSGSVAPAPLLDNNIKKENIKEKWRLLDHRRPFCCFSPAIIAQKDVASPPPATGITVIELPPYSTPVSRYIYLSFF